jgi:hypothetical protein
MVMMREVDPLRTSLRKIPGHAHPGHGFVSARILAALIFSTLLHTELIPELFS